MSRERIEAAAKAFYGDAYEDVFQADKSHALDQITDTLAAADAVMFSDEAIERAAKANFRRKTYNEWETLPESIKAVWRKDIRTTVAALRGES